MTATCPNPPALRAAPFTKGGFWVPSFSKGGTGRISSASITEGEKPQQREGDTMQFGFMQDFRNPQPWRRPYPELYRALLDQIVRAEELGYDQVWLTEHHFTEDGYNPSLLPTAAAIATRTSRIRLGTFA